MDGLFLLIAFVGFVSAAKFGLRMYLTVNHPKVREAWDEAEERRAERHKKMAGGAVHLAGGLAKTFLKK